jgi:hypothetical protein
LDNWQAKAYGWVSLYQLLSEDEEINPDKLSGRMSYLMDMYSETEIEKLKEKLKNKYTKELIEKENN